MSTMYALPQSNRADTLSGLTRRVTLEPGVANEIVVQIQDAEVTETVSFERARLIDLRARQQYNRSNELQFMVSSSIIVEGLQVTLDGEAHPLLSEERYAAYLQLPHRISAQQWVKADQAESVIAAVNDLKNNHGFRTIRNPKLRPDSTRTTRDQFVSRPGTRLDPNNPSAYGVALDSFEISINPDYREQGFRGFWEGLSDQQQRWDQIRNNDATIGSLSEDEVARTLHMIGGVYFSSDDGRLYPRSVDVGILTFGGTEHAFYNVDGDDISVEDLFGGQTNPSTRAADLTGPDLTAPPVDSNNPF